MTGPHPQAQDPSDVADIRTLLRSREIRYPIPDRADFVAQMCAASAPVTFRGQDYEPEFAANLVSDFLFPISSEQDMLTKVGELLVSRGLLPIEALGRPR